ncbi:MAG: coproporphyrinogen dehydrogenase HemZ [Clostridiales bacterium]|nr:coproporphyrinogen dehydrogenase HemZ [Clostridiales bacterium]
MGNDSAGQFNYDLVVYMAFKGKDISQQIRPLIQSFFGNVVYECENTADLVLKENADIQILMDYQDDYMDIKVYEGSVLYEAYHSDDVPEDIREYRYKAGRGIYDILHKMTGKELPWGILVGIRPTKHVYESITRGESPERIKRRFTEEFYVSEEKTDISVDIACREKRILDSFDYRNGYSIYIGIPFCPTTCLYCSFTSYPLSRFGSYMNDYIEALIKEIKYAGTAISGKKLHTIYIGGGTPTALDEYNLERLLQAVCTYLPADNALEFCVEAGRPDTITKEKLILLKKYGVDRISINPQTLVEKTLEVIGRRHTVQSVFDSFFLARECGHDNINMDLIIGLTGEGTEEVKKTLEGVELLKPESLTVHTLALKRAARLKIENDKYRGREGKNIHESLRLTGSFAASQGLNPYYLYRQKNMAENLENVGYAKEGRECLYNILIMEEKQTILALGAGATTKYVYDEERLDRIENVKSLTDYIGRIDEMIDRKRNFLNNLK